MAKVRLEVPNAPYGVESLHSKALSHSELVLFLMHRMELKVSIITGHRGT